LIIAGGGGYLLRKRLLRSSDRPRLRTHHRHRGPITAKVTATGTLSALVTVQVGTQVSDASTRSSVRLQLDGEEDR